MHIYEIVSTFVKLYIGMFMPIGLISLASWSYSGMPVCPHITPPRFQSRNLFQAEARYYDHFEPSYDKIGWEIWERHYQTPKDKIPNIKCHMLVFLGNSNIDGA